MMFKCLKNSHTSVADSIAIDQNTGAEVGAGAGA